MKKILVMMMAMVMLLTVVLTCAACDGNTVVATGKGPVDVKDLKIGVLHINPTDSKAGYTAAHESGIQYMMSELGLTEDQVMRKDSLLDTDNKATAEAIDNLIAEGCNVIIGTSFGYMDTMLLKAKENPNVVFSHGSGYQSCDNMNNYFGRIYQARYLSGIVAGLKASVGGKLGYVSAHDFSIAECSSGLNAFALGVQSVNPTATVYANTISSWYNPSLEQSNAEALLEMGCEVISHHSDTENPCKAAKEAGKFSVGYNTDMGNYINDDSVLASVVWHWGVYYKMFVQSVIDGTFADLGNYYEDYAAGLFGLTELSSKCAPDTAAILKLVTDKLCDANNDWDVFTNTALSFAKVDGAWTVVETERQLKDNNGNAVTVNDGNITGDMKYYVEGVEFLSTTAK